MLFHLHRLKLLRLGTVSAHFHRLGTCRERAWVTVAVFAECILGSRVLSHDMHHPGLSRHPSEHEDVLSFPRSLSLHKETTGKISDQDMRVASIQGKEAEKGASCTRPPLN